MLWRSCRHTAGRRRCRRGADSCQDTTAAATVTATSVNAVFAAAAVAFVNVVSAAAVTNFYCCPFYFWWCMEQRCCSWPRIAAATASSLVDKWEGSSLTAAPNVVIDDAYVICVMVQCC